MSEFQNEQLSEMSNDDLEEQIDEDDDEISLKPKQDNSDSEDEDTDEEVDEEVDDVIDEVKDEDEDDDEHDDEDDDEVKDETQKSNLDKITNDIENEPIINYSDDDEDEFDDYDETEFRKIDQDVKQDYLMKYHQESKIHNFEEIISMAKVLRDKNNNIIDELHKTAPILTKYEKTRILGERTKQINNGSKPFTEVQNDIIDGYLIACKELEEKKIPFIIRRPLPSGGSEYWHLKDLELVY